MTSQSFFLTLRLISSFVMKIQNFFFLLSFTVLSLFISCSKDDTNKVIDKVSDYYVRCDADTGTGTFKFDVNTPYGKFEKNTKSVVITAQSLNNLNLTITLYTGKDTLSSVTSGNYPLYLDTSLVIPSSLQWGFTETSALADNDGKKISVTSIEEKENGKRLFIGTFEGNIGNGNRVKLKNGQFKVLVNP